jgi:hypothetical protein
LNLPNAFDGKLVTVAARARSIAIMEIGRTIERGRYVDVVSPTKRQNLV